MSSNKLIEYIAWVVFAILAFWGIVTAIDAIVKFFSTHMWLLWLIIALIVMGVIIFFMHNFIARGFKRLLTKFKNKTSDNVKPTNNNKTTDTYKEND